MTLDKKTVEAIGADAEKALAEVATKYGLTVKMDGRGIYDPEAETLRIKYEFAGDDAARIKFEREAQWYGLEAEDFGKELKFSNGTFRIVGINRRASKKPVVLKNVQTGRDASAPVDSVLRVLGREVKPPTPIVTIDRNKEGA